MPENSGFLNKLFVGDCVSMPEIPDGAIDFILTSPPYNARKKYDIHDDEMPIPKYKEFLTERFKEIKRVLRKDGGRMALNIPPNVHFGQANMFPLSAFCVMTLESLGFTIRGDIIWQKGAARKSHTAWGSFCSPSQPYIKNNHELVHIFNRQGEGKREDIERHLITQTPEGFKRDVESVWTVNPESSNKHPAIMPKELAIRILRLYTQMNDVVLDPFCGTGTTALAAKEEDRAFVGYDISPDYIEMAKSRLAQNPLFSLNEALAESSK